MNAPKYANEVAALANDRSFNPKDFAPKAAADLQQLFGNPTWTDGQPLFVRSTAKRSPMETGPITTRQLVTACSAAPTTLKPPANSSGGTRTRCE